MKNLGKKSMIGLAAGAVFLAGSIIPLVAQAAASTTSQRPGITQSQASPNKLAQDITDTFGVSKADVLQYHNQGYDFKELFRGSFLAKASGKSLKEVMSLKNSDTSWMSVAQTLGVNKEKMYVTHKDIEATQMEKTLSIPKKISASFMRQGYHAQDIANANILAKNTDKPISAILAMKKINNTWFDVAQSLGVSDDVFTQGTKEIDKAIPRIFFHRKYSVLKA
jgi:hypothetical protein